MGSLSLPFAFNGVVQGMKNQEQRPVLSVDLVVTNSDGQILLGHVTEKWSDRGRYNWGLPGREIMLGENLRAAAARSLHEELGLRMTSVRFLSVNSNFGFGNHYVSISMLVEATGSMINKQPADWTRWHWVEPSGLPERLFPSAARTLHAYLKGSTSLDLSEQEEPGYS